MANIVLAIDQSTTSTGWALFSDGKLIDYGIVRATGEEIERINIMRTWLKGYLQELKLNYDEDKIQVVLEDIQLQHGDASTFKILARLQGVLANIVYRHDIPLSYCYASEWKSTCGVKGKQRQEQKKNAQLYVENTYGLKIIQDISDAICIGTHFCKRKLNAIETRKGRA